MSKFNILIIARALDINNILYLNKI